MSEQLATIHSLAQSLGKLLLNHQWQCTAAESCTGGALCTAITDIPGASQWFERGFITYSNTAKTELLDVPQTILDTEGAVSEATAIAMAEGALKRSLADISVAITGIAGPDGGTPNKPVGTVWIACADHINSPTAKCYFFEGNRQAIRHQSVFHALQKLIKHCT